MGDMLKEEIKEETKLRDDKRKGNQLRPMSCEQGLLKQADGSSKYSQSNSSVVAGVFGPVEVRHSEESFDKSTIEVIFRPEVGVAIRKHKILEFCLRSTLEQAILTSLHPRTAVRLVIQEVSGDGAVLSCALNAACLALIDASLPLKQPFAAVSIALMKSGLF